MYQSFFKSIVFFCVSINSDLHAFEMTDTINEFANPRWENLWKAGIVPGQLFDKTSTNKALLSLIEKNEIPQGRALVPGCGRGYDVISLASSSRYSVGLDLCSEAIDAAESYYYSLPKESRPPKDLVNFKAGNFFDLSADESEKFDFVYDYTFLCALDPTIREYWAQKMSDIIRVGGELLTLIYPIDEHEGGPPFKVSLELVRDLLLPVGFEQMELRMLPDELCHPGREGRSGIGRWRRISILK